MAKPSAESLQKIHIDTIIRIKSNFKDPKDRHNTQYFEVRLERLQEAWGKCKELHPVVYNMKMHNQTLLKDYISSGETAEETALDFMARLRKAIKKLDDEQRPPQHAANQPASFLAASGNDPIRLGRIKISKFEGDYLKWAAFHELFQMFVHENSQLRDIQKLQYLLTSVGGEARGLIGNLAMIEANYSKAWQLLQNLYDNKRIILAAYLQTFMDLPVIKSESAAGYKKILDTTNEMMAGIGSIDIEASTWYPVIIHIASHKLDLGARKEWEESCGVQTKIPTWRDFADFLQRKFGSLEVIGRENSSKGEHTSMKGLGPRVDTTTQKISGSSLCKEPHSIYKCGKLQKSSTEHRREFVKAHNLCFNCLKNHRVYECESTTLCKICNKKHNSVLHLDQGSRAKEPDTKGASAHNQVEIESNHVNRGSMNNILLAPAIINVKNVHGQFVQLRALIDQGSQNSFVAEEAVKLLGIKREHANVVINGISSSTRKCYGQVLLIMQEKFANKTISNNALIFGRLTSDLPSTTLNQVKLRCSTDELVEPNYHEYNKCLQDYLVLNHMEEVPKNDINNLLYYLPHHAVVRETSSTTKVRVVFNASAKTSSGKSLNDILLVGPTIQDTLVSLLLRWSLYPVVLTADITKMCRQIQVNPKNAGFQRIVWRPHSANIIRHYRLRTLTFGTASAPFKAARTG